MWVQTDFVLSVSSTQTHPVLWCCVLPWSEHKAKLANTPRGVSPFPVVFTLIKINLQIVCAERQMATGQSEIHFLHVSVLVHPFIPASTLCSRRVVWPCWGSICLQVRMSEVDERLNGIKGEREIYYVTDDDADNDGDDEDEGIPGASNGRLYLNHH